MLNMRTWLLGFVVAFCLIISAGCGLTRSKASSLISDDARFATSHTVAYDDWLPLASNADSEHGAFSRAMSSLGYMDGDGKLTAKGENAKKDWNEKKVPIFAGPDMIQYEITVGKRELVEVTGLTDDQNPAGSFVEATFTWRWAAVGDVGKEMGIDQKTYKGEAQFQKFDDGWRVSNIRFNG